MAFLPFDPFGAAGLEDPHPVYRRYREAGPVHPAQRVQPGRTTEVWYVFGYAECVQGLKDPVLGRAGLYDHQRAVVSEPSVLDSILLIDPPDHTRLRRLVSLAFTPRAVARVIPRLDTLAQEVLGDLADRATWDVIGDFAFPFPVTVISELLGVPLGDRALIRQWSRALTASLDATDDAETYRRAYDAHRVWRTATFGVPDDYLGDARAGCHGRVSV